ncbi:hypothetical protein B0H10DRAFT_2440659 [Mycena sp. CBHHK59/15]|nr:hypothetical protein B0H10DRAFT_2440659 [Mycena sp. CBHHK59/15]
MDAWGWETAASARADEDRRGRICADGRNLARHGLGRMRCDSARTDEDGSTRTSPAARRWSARTHGVTGARTASRMHTTRRGRSCARGMRVYDLPPDLAQCTCGVSVRAGLSSAHGGGREWVVRKDASVAFTNAYATIRVCTRAKVRGALGNLGGDYFLRIFYRDFQGDPKHVQEGYCQSRYLVKSYKSVFTAPSSAEKDDDENTPPMKKAKTAGPNGKCVAVILNMDGKVTGRSIAYVVVLLWLSLTTTTAWTDEYYDVSLAQMYDFIVDYFEGPEEGTLARERIDALLAWRNKYVVSRFWLLRSDCTIGRSTRPMHPPRPPTRHPWRLGPRCGNSVRRWSLRNSSSTIWNKLVFSPAIARREPKLKIKYKLLVCASPPEHCLSEHGQTEG